MGTFHPENIADRDRDLRRPAPITNVPGPGPTPPRLPDPDPPPSGSSPGPGAFRYSDQPRVPSCEFSGRKLVNFALNDLNDAKTQYLYKAAAERMSERSALLIADTIVAAQPGASHASRLFHHLVWLKHAGFGTVDCFWRQADSAVYGGFKWPPGATA